MSNEQTPEQEPTPEVPRAERRQIGLHEANMRAMRARAPRTAEHLPPAIQLEVEKVQRLAHTTLQGARQEAKALVAEAERSAQAIVEAAQAQAKAVREAANAEADQVAAQAYREAAEAQGVTPGLPEPEPEG